MKIRILAAFLALLFVVSTALVSCDELDSMLEDLSSGLESGEVDDELEGGKHNGKNDKDDDDDDDRDDDDDDDRYDDDDDDRDDDDDDRYDDDDDDRYDDDDDDRFGTGKDDSNDKDTMTQYPDSEYGDETFTSPEDSEESTKPSTNRPDFETNEYGDETFTSPEDSEESTKPSTNRPGFETNEYGEETFTSPNDYSIVAADPEVNGETLNIIVRNYTPAMREWYKDMPEDEIDEIVAYRNESVAARIKLSKVSYTLMGGSGYEDCLNTFTTAIMADVDNAFHYYDIVANYAYAGATPVVRNYLANLADYETFPYFDFTLPCWNQAIVNTTLVNDKLYYITGDLNLSTFDKTMVVFINKYLYNDRKDASDPEDLQDVALDGLWDYEDLYKWASVYEDTSADGINTHDDLHGISAAYGSIPLDAMPYAWDLEYLVEEADGSHSYNVIGNTKIEEAVDMAKELFHGVSDSDQTGAQGVGNWNNTGGCTFGGYSEPVTHFACDLSVFTFHLLYCTADDNVMMREMSSEFGLLPMPKFDEDQENYGTTAHESYTLITVIDHEDIKGSAISAYLQLSSEESYTNIRGFYINEIVKQKYFGLSDSREKSQDIFDIIADNVEFTFISVYAPQLNSILNSCWRDVVTESNVLGATTAEEAFLLDETMYDVSLAEVDQWLGLI